METIKPENWNVTDIKKLISDPQTANLLLKWIGNEETFSFQTSGSTGIPKTISFSRKQILSSIQRTVNFFSYTSQDHFLCHLSPTAVSGAMVLLRAAECKASLTIFKPLSNPLEKIEDEHPYTVTSFVPMQLSKMSEVNNLKRFKNILIGGAPINAELHQWLSNLENVYETYGMTETISHVAVRKVGRDRFFHALPGVEIRINEIGCIEIKCNTTNDEWLATNDLAKVEGNGEFDILGRADGIINSGGVKINPLRIENQISSLILGRNFFVASKPDQILGEKLILIVEGETSPAITTSFLKQVLSAYDLPKEIIYVSKFDITSSGKIDKQRILSQLP